MSDFFSSAAYPQQGTSSFGTNNAAGTPYGQPSHTANNATPYGQPSQTTNTNTQQQQQQQQSWSNSSGQAMNSGAPPGPTAHSSTPSPSLWTPGMESTVKGVASLAKANPDAMLNMGAKWTQDIISEGTARMIPGLNQFMSSLRVYFAVDNNYVQRKMRKVLFSFFFKEWRRMQLESPPPGQPPKYALPLNDDNAPDLYIPAMSLISYVLLCALVYGTTGHFSPEILSDVTWKCLLIQFLEIFAFRLVFYLLQAPISLLDLLSITGYKYLGLTLNMFLGVTLNLLLGFGQVAYYGMFVWTAATMSYFMFKTMENWIPYVTASAGPKRELVVIGFAASQLATMWFLGQTKFLS